MKIIDFIAANYDHYATIAGRAAARMASGAECNYRGLPSHVEGSEILSNFIEYSIACEWSNLELDFPLIGKWNSIDENVAKLTKEITNKIYRFLRNSCEGGLRFWWLDGVGTYREEIREKDALDRGKSRRPNRLGQMWETTGEIPSQSTAPQIQVNLASIMRIIEGESKQKKRRRYRELIRLHAHESVKGETWKLKAGAVREYCELFETSRSQCKRDIESLRGLLAQHAETVDIA